MKRIFLSFIELQDLLSSVHLPPFLFHLMGKTANLGSYHQTNNAIPHFFIEMK